MMIRKERIVIYILTTFITLVVVFPFLWMLILSFKTNEQILLSPLSMPQSLDLTNYRSALESLNYARLYGNTALICVFAMVIEISITYMSSFALARIPFSRGLNKAIYSYLIAGLSISPFVLLFPVYKICVFLGIGGKAGLIATYVATSISFNTLLLVGYLKTLPKEIDEAAVIDGCNLRDLMLRVILPMTKPVIATVVIFNVLYIWNEYPFASIMLRDVTDFTLSMGASFFKGTYTVNYGGIVASSVMIIIPELIFYGVFQKYIVEGMTAGAVKG